MHPPTPATPEHAIARLLIENSTDGIVAYDRELRYIEWNPAMERVMGVSRSEIIGKRIFDLFPELSATRELPMRAALSGETMSAPDVEMNVAGKLRYFSAVHGPLRDSEGNVIGGIGVVRDTTGPREFAEKLRQSEERFRALFEESPYSIGIFSPEGHLVRLNRAGMKDWKLTPEQLDNALKDYRFFDDEALKRVGVMDLYRRAFAGQAVEIPPFPYDADPVTLDGRRRWLHAYAYPLCNAQGEVQEVVVIHRDVSRQMEFEKKLEKAAAENAHLFAEASAALRARDEFLSIASHELKTPLTSLHMGLQVLHRGLSGDDRLGPAELRELAAVCDKQSRKLGQLIEELLDLTRAREGKLTLRRERADLAELVGEAVERMQPQLRAARCELRTELRARPQVELDRARIEQVLVNLLTNAAKYAPGSRIEVLLEADPQHARLVVKDDGPGIAHDDQGKLFERFERAGPSSYVPGLGLGLYIVRKIVEAHDGSVRLESAPGQGAAFEILLPLRGASS